MGRHDNLRCDVTNLMATFSEDRIFTPDQAVALRFDPAEAHLFPSES